MDSHPIALVTGASRGIGAAVARCLSDSHELLLGGRDPDGLRALADEFPAARPWPVELTDAESVAAAAAEIDQLDVLVHSAGVGQLGTIAETPTDTWRRVFELNLFAVTQLTRALLPALRAGGGHVVLINSGAGLDAKPNWGAYAASKFALRAFADVLRSEEAGNGIRVTSVFPGRTATDMQREIRDAEGGDFDPARYLRPDSVAGAVAAAVRASADAHPTEIVLRPFA